jgi:hypothetical protein
MRYLSEKDNFMKGLYKFAVAFEKASQVPSIEQIRGISDKGPFGGAIPAKAPAAPVSAAIPKSVQFALMSLGFPLPKHGADGLLGKETKDAIQAFKTKFPGPNSSPDALYSRILDEASKYEGKKPSEQPVNQPAQKVTRPIADVKGLRDTSTFVNPKSDNFTVGR